MTKRDRLMLLTVLAVALLGGFWMLVLNPQRQAATDAVAQVESAQAALEAARQQVDAGRRAQTAFQRDRTTIVKLGRVVPETDDIPTLLTQLSALARKEKVGFDSYAIDQAAGSTGSSSGGSTDTGSSTSTSQQTGGGSTNAVAPLFPPGSVEIDGGLGRTPIALELSGTYFQLERYLRAVQRFAVLSQKSSKTDGRLMIVDGFSYGAADSSAEETQLDEKELARKLFSESPKLKATLSASIYFAPPLSAPGAGSSAGSAASPATGGTTAPPSGSSTGTAAIGGVQ